ncbi:MAG: DinB family protein [Asgard group archaeon]|nr:DinB family protein [Asgard group archaeon]
MDGKSEKALRKTEFEELSPRVALWYSLMYETRERLFRVLRDLTQEELDYTPDERKFETIGTLLFHIAAVEWSWIFEDIDEQKMDFEEFKHGFALNPEVNIPQLKNQRLQFYVNKLEKIRQEVYQRLKKFKDEDLDRIVESEGEKYSIEWILFHLIEHEAMHIGQIQLLKRLFSKEK